MTGFSGAGKSTLSEAVKERLDVCLGDSTKVYILDGDKIRKGLNADLGFSWDDVHENSRRIGEVAKILADSGQLVFVAFISPIAELRNKARGVHEEAGHPFIECHVSTSIDICEERDVKGLYAKARMGVIKNF